MSLRLRQLRYFVVVAEAGQITRAATKLQVAQPALSQAIAQLESEVGVTLLDRHARGVSLTPAGEALLGKARVALDAVAEAHLAARTLSRARRGTLEFGFIGAPPMVDAPELFAALAGVRPDVEVAFRELTFPRAPVASWLEADAALCFSPPHGDRLARLTLREEPRAIVASRKHRIGGHRSLSVADVLDETFLGSHPTVDAGWMGFWRLDDHRGEPCRRVSTDRAINPQETAAALASGRAIIAAPETNARNFTSALSELTVIPLRDADPADLNLLWHRESPNPLVAALVETARALSESRARPG